MKQFRVGKAVEEMSKGLQLAGSPMLVLQASFPMWTEGRADPSACSDGCEGLCTQTEVQLSALTSMRIRRIINMRDDFLGPRFPSSPTQSVRRLMQGRVPE